MRRPGKPPTSSPLFQISRRDFLKRASLTAAAAGLPPWFVAQTLDAAEPARAASANDKPSVALIGCGGRGRGVAKEASVFGKVVAVCDVDAQRAAQAGQQFAGAKIYKDYRELLRHADLHAIINGTPDHWHTVINLAAMKAGKDVYSEKPLTLTIEEGRRLVKAAKASQRILQTGSQQRSDARFRLACELARNGRIGKLEHVITSLPAGPREGPFAKAPVPPGLDWEMWQGQAPERDYVPERCHRNFRYWLEYSGGTMTDWGAHHNDIALWGLGLERSGPVSVEGKQLIEPIAGGYTAPSEYAVDYTYANGVTHRCQSASSNGPDGSTRGKPREGEMPHGVKFVGSEGWIFVTRGKIEASAPEVLKEPLTKKSVELYVSEDHMGNFFDCMRTRKAPICDAEIGHRSVSICHLGVIAIRLGRKLRWDPEQEQFAGDAEANGYVAREQRKPYAID
jgi:predicted dehydrogenase